MAKRNKYIIENAKMMSNCEPEININVWYAKFTKSAIKLFWAVHKRRHQ